MDTPAGFVELVFLEVSKAQQNAILVKHSDCSWSRRFGTGNLQIHLPTSTVLWLCDYWLGKHNKKQRWNTMCTLAETRCSEDDLRTHGNIDVEKCSQGSRKQDIFLFFQFVLVFTGIWQTSTGQNPTKINSMSACFVVWILIFFFPDEMKP